MAAIKLLCWNMEWMNDLFDSNGNFHPDNHKPQHSPDTTVKTRREHLAGVINDISPDVVVVVEGPNTTNELKLFFDTDVTGTWQAFLQPTSGSSQCIGCAVRTDTGKFDNANPLQPFDTSPEPAFDPFEMENEGDGIIEKYKFERLPLYAQINAAGNKAFRVMGLHLKSKGIFDAYEWSKWWSVADANRKKILAQTSQVRQKFLDEYLSAAATKNIPLIVCGDINDGPGMDASEKRLLGSGIERLMGNIWRPQFCMGNALFDTLSVNDQKNLNFEKIHTTTFKDPIFNNVWHREWIDHILYSLNKPGWAVNAKVHQTMSDGKKIWEKFKHASDHIPISVEINL
ncbi:MAG: hypothetical protein SFU87_16060 [Chitinophagaceae bacterium]|nr:hypothetical protein [Chitinophagaceae bacterium]